MLSLLTALALAGDRPATLDDLRYAERYGDRLLVRASGLDAAPTGPWSGLADGPGWRTTAPTTAEPGFPAVWQVGSRQCRVVDFVVAAHEWSDGDPYTASEAPRCGAPARYAVLDCPPGPEDELSVPVGVRMPTRHPIGEPTPSAPMSALPAWRSLAAEAGGRDLSARATRAAAGPGALLHHSAHTGEGQWQCGGEDLQLDLFAWSPTPEAPPTAVWTSRQANPSATAVILLESGPILELDGQWFVPTTGERRPARVETSCVCPC